MSVYNKINTERMPVIVASARTPFLHSGGAYADLLNYQLAALPLAEVLARSGVSANDVEAVSVGAVVQDVDTTNVAREAMLHAGYPGKIPAYTISMAGISPNLGLMNLCDMIALGRVDIAVAGGSENFSDLPIRMSRNVRKRAVKLALAKSNMERLKILAGLRPGDIVPVLPSSLDMTTKLTMGQACEAMAKRFGVGRKDADAFALRSHQNAAAAWEAGYYDQDVMEVAAPNGEKVRRDNTFRVDTSAEKLGRLKPSFDKDAGIITAGNASGITDGATAILLMNEAKARAKDLPLVARVRDYQIGGVNDLKTEMLLGPAATIPMLLKRNRLNIADIGVFELHEAFAAQVLANQTALASDEFCQTELQLDKAPGAIPLEKLNNWGGSIALGNPFAGTGGRILMTACHRLQQSGEKYAVIATCAGGGLGAALLLENPHAN